MLGLKNVSVSEDEITKLDKKTRKSDKKDLIRRKSPSEKKNSKI